NNPIFFTKYSRSNARVNNSGLSISAKKKFPVSNTRDKTSAKTLPLLGYFTESIFDCFLLKYQIKITSANSKTSYALIKVSILDPKSAMLLAWNNCGTVIKSVKFR